MILKALLSALRLDGGALAEAGDLAAGMVVSL
jgi:hypothetical protein